MAEGDSHIYQEYKKGIATGNYDLVADTVVALLVASYTLDEAGDTLLADVVAAEISDPSYARQTLTGKTVTAEGSGTGTDLQGMFDAADVTFPSLSGTNPNYLILFNDTPTSPLDPLILALELTTPSNGGDYIIIWHADGIVRNS